MDDERQRFIEDFEVLFEDLGGGRMVGRILGLLMVADPPYLSAEEIANALDASRGSISQATRVLVQLGMVRRFTRPGERRDFFELRADAFTEATRRRDQEIVRLIAMFERARKLAAPDSTRLDETLAFLRFWRQKFHQMFHEWEVEREQLLNDQRDRNP